MKKFGFSLALCALLFGANGLSQDKSAAYLLMESVRKNAGHLKSGFVGGYPQHTEEFTWTTDWVLSRTIETSYKSFGEPEVMIYTLGEDKTKELFSYDGQNQLTERKTQVWIGGVWVDHDRWVATYNSFGYQVEARSEILEGSSWVILSGTQSVLTMDGDRIHIITTKDWNSDTGTWVESGRRTYSYEGAGQKITGIIFEKWENQWLLNSKVEYSWSGNQLSQAIMYDYVENAWKRSGKYDYEYPDDYTSITTMSMDDEAGGWTPFMRFSDFSDSHGNLTLSQTEMYMDAWIVFTATKYLLTYAGNNLTQVISQISQFTSGGAWENQGKSIFSNFASLSTDVTPLDAAGLKVFPNPAGMQATISLSLLKTGPVTLQVISVNGQKILEETFTASALDVYYLLNLKKVPRGSYLLVASDKQGVEIGKTRLIRQ